jgi:hypothetical protein
MNDRLWSIVEPSPTQKALPPENTTAGATARIPPPLSRCSGRRRRLSQQFTRIGLRSRAQVGQALGSRCLTCPSSATCSKRREPVRKARRRRRPALGAGIRPSSVRSRGSELTPGWVRKTDHRRIHPVLLLQLAQDFRVALSGLQTRTLVPVIPSVWTNHGPIRRKGLNVTGETANFFVFSHPACRDDQHHSRTARPPNRSGPMLECFEWKAG